jgi:phospholipase C
MGVYVDGSLVKVVNGNQLNTVIPLAVGNHATVVQEWDYCGGSTYTQIAVTVATQSSVSVVSPISGSTVNMLTNYVATAVSTCPKGVASMGIDLNNQLVYTVAGAKLNTMLSLSPGAQHTVVQEWDNCGGSVYSAVNVNVANGGNTISNIQAFPGWQSWGQLPPVYADCSPCSGLNWSMLQGGSHRHP